jgi:hypothetical protein
VSAGCAFHQVWTRSLQRSLEARLASPSLQLSPSEQADECIFSLVPLPTFLCLHFQLFHAFFLHNNTQIKGTKIVYQCIAFHLK